MKESYEKVIKTIRSCKTPKQLYNAEKLIVFYEKLFNKCVESVVYEHILRMELIGQKLKLR